MTLTEEQRAALKRVAAYMDEMYSVASPYHGCTEDSDLLRAMIDSSEDADYESLRCENCGKTLKEIRGSKYAGDYRLGEIRIDPGQEASISDPPIEPSYYFWCDECKNDSSEHFSERTKMVAFDLERARGLRDFLQDDCAEVGDVWGEMIAEIERLRAALAESEKVVEHKGKSATHWYDEHLRAQTDLTQSKRVIEQQVARIKSLKKEIRRLKHESKVEQEFTNSYIKNLHETEARIKELEDAHKRAGAKYAKIIRELRSSVYANIPGLKKQWDEVLAEDKIGSSDHSSDVTKKVWKITEERKAAIDRGMRFLAWSNANTNDPETELDLVVLRAMLEEAE